MSRLEWQSAKRALEVRIQKEIQKFEMRFPDIEVALSVTRVRNPDEVFVDITLEPKP